MLLYFYSAVEWSDAPCCYAYYKYLWHFRSNLHLDATSLRFGTSRQSLEAHPRWLAAVRQFVYVTHSPARSWILWSLPLMSHVQYKQCYDEIQLIKYWKLSVTAVSRHLTVSSDSICTALVCREVITVFRGLLSCTCVSRLRLFHNGCLFHDL